MHRRHRTPLVMTQLKLQLLLRRQILVLLAARWQLRRLPSNLVACGGGLLVASGRDGNKYKSSEVLVQEVQTSLRVTPSGKCLRVAQTTRRLLSLQLQLRTLNSMTLECHP